MRKFDLIIILHFEIKVVIYQTTQVVKKEIVHLYQETMTRK